MGNYEQLKAAIAAAIKANGMQEITGDVLQATLLSLVSNIGNNATFAGIATPDTNPGTPDQNVFYLAAQPGVYSNFGGVELTNQVLIFTNKNGNWVKTDSGIEKVTEEEKPLLLYNGVFEETKTNFSVISYKLNEEVNLLYKGFIPKKTTITFEIYQAREEITFLYALIDGTYKEVCRIPIGSTQVAKTTTEDVYNLKIYSNTAYTIESCNLKLENKELSISGIADSLNTTKEDIALKLNKSIFDEVVKENTIYNDNYTGTIPDGDTSKNTDIFISQNQGSIKEGDKLYLKIENVDNSNITQNLASIDFYQGNTRININYYTRSDIGTIKEFVAPENADGYRVVARMQISQSSVGETNILYTDVLVARTASDRKYYTSSNLFLDIPQEDFENQTKIAIDELFVPTMQQEQISNLVKTAIHGATVNFPANTLGLYKWAYRNKIIYWECDVRPCLDGYVLCHDDDIYNHAVTADGSVIPQGTVLISQKNISELKQYKFGVITNKQGDGLVPGFENDTIPTLQEYILLSKALGAYPVVEIKFNATEQQITDIVDIVNKLGMLEYTTFIAYAGGVRDVKWLINNGVKNIIYISVQNTYTNAAVDELKQAIEETGVTDLKNVWIGSTLGQFNESVLQYAANNGYKTNLYTIFDYQSDQSIVEYFNNGITLFTTNIKNCNDLIKKSYL